MKRSPLLRKSPLRSKSKLSGPRKPMRKRSKTNQGWVDVAVKLWEESDRTCEVCGKYLGDDFSPTFFHHLLHRGSYRSLKREPLNLARVCAMDHAKAHLHGVENMAEEGSENPDGWLVLALRLTALRDHANGITSPRVRSTYT